MENKKLPKLKKVSHGPGDLVKQANPITTARYDLGQHAQKAFLLAYSKLTPQDEEFPRFEFSLSEVARVLGNTAGDARAVIGILRKLQKEAIELWEGGEWVSYMPLPTIRVSEVRKTVTFRLNGDLQPYFLKLKSQFTMFPVENAFKLHGKYSLRLYQLLMQWQGKADKAGFWSVEIEVLALRDMWEITPNEYPLTHDLRRFVIERAVLEINSAGLGLALSMLPPKKQGKNITHFVIGVQRIKEKLTNHKAGTQVETEEEAWIRLNPELYAKYLDQAEKQGTLPGVEPTLPAVQALRDLRADPKAVKPSARKGKTAKEV